MKKLFSLFIVMIVSFTLVACNVERVGEDEDTDLAKNTIICWEF